MDAPTLCTLEALKTQQGITSVTDDALLTAYILSASNIVRTYTDRDFVPFVQTRVYDVPTRRSLFLDADLLTVTSIADTATLTSDEYLLYPANRYPKNEIRRTTVSPVWTFAESGEQAITVTGTWGYHPNPDAMWRRTGATLTNAIDADDTALTVNSTANIGTLSYIKIGSEFMYVTAKTATVLTVERAVRGSTASAHDAASALTVFAVIEDVTDVTAQLAQWMYLNRDKAGIEQVQILDGSVLISNQAPRVIKETLNRYVRLTWQAVV